MKRVSLDTNAYTALMKGDRKILEILGFAEEIFISVFVIGELLFGFTAGSKEEANRQTFNNFLKKPTVKILHTTMETAEIFGRLKNALKKRGTPIPVNDVWIAAHSVENGSFLVSYNSHFDNIPGLLLL